MPPPLPDSDSEDELPPNWEERATNDGFVFYIHHQKKTTQWSHPRTGKLKRVSGDLPIGWIKKTEEETGKILFIETETNRQTYTDPRLAFAVEEAALNAGEIRQKFDASSQALQILHGRDLSGKVALITGSNVGIGFETARSLALHKCEVIMACRNEQSAKEAISKIENEKAIAGQKCRFVKLDLASLRATKEFTDKVKEDIKHIDFLILNAGVFGLPFSTTEDGYETTFQVCHLSHFLLTNELSDLLDQHSRVIVVSSESHRFANLPADGLTENILSPPYQKYWSMMAYNNVKLCNILFAVELARKWKHRGISVFSLHPGNMVSSYLSRNWWFYRLLFAFVRPFTKSLQQASSTTIFCATSTDLMGLTGLYFNNCFVCEPSKISQSEEMAKTLWQISEEMVKRVLK